MMRPLLPTARATVLALFATQTSAIERETGYKVYAPGVGLIKDEECLSVKVVKAEASK